MIFLFTKSKRLGSKLIRWGLEEPASHFAPVYSICPKKTKGVLFHSNFSGFKLDWLQGYVKTCEVVLALEPKNLSQEDEHKIVQNIITKLWGLDYDINALMYFTYRAARRKLMGHPLPDVNEWDTDNILCTGVAKHLFPLRPDWFVRPILNEDIISPWALAQNMLDSGAFVRLDVDLFKP